MSEAAVEVVTRRTASEDIPAICRLIDSKAKSVYNHSDLQIHRVLETSVISISAFRGDDLVAFGAFNITKEFEDRVATLDQSIFSPESTLFIRLFLSDEESDVSSKIAPELFKSLFTFIPTLHHILSDKIDPKLGEIFNSTNDEKVFTANRDQFVSELFVRPAKVEDNDDISRIYQKESDQLKQFYGEFFFTEMVESVDKYHKVLVADFNDTPVGAMSVTSNISIDLLRKTHHIGHLNGLNQTNAIAIQIFTISAEYKTRSIDLVRAAFGQFDEAEWAIISFPRQVEHFPLLNFFTRVTPKVSIVDKEVYVVHRGILHGNNRVRPAQIEDVEPLGRIDKKLSKLVQQAILDGHSETQNRINTLPFVICLGAQPIGGIVVEQEDQIDRIRSFFDIENFITFNQQEAAEHFKIVRCSMAPGFHALTRMILSETMRLSNCITLYQRVTPSAPQSPITREMIPVLPRQKIYFDFEKLGANAPPETSLGDCDFGLMLLGRKHVTIETTAVSHAIVVVGASDVGVAAVQRLAMTPHLIFNNLTLVSPIFHDDKFIAVGKKRETVETRLVNHFGAAKTGLNVSVNRVRGTMAGIHPAKQRLILRDGTQLPYDLLLLTTGKQVKGLSARPDTGLNGFEIGKLIKWLQNTKSAKLFIYGSRVDTLALIQRLLANEVAPERITLGLEKTLADLFDISVGDDRKTTETGPDFESVSAFVSAALTGLNIDVVDGISKIEALGAQTNTGIIGAVRVNDTHEYECDALVDLNRKSVDQNVFKTLNNACLVYDGALIVDTNFSTSNDYILAAGPLTKYPRRLHADAWTHDKFNSDDVGEAAGNEILKRIFDAPSEPQLSVPRFSSPIVESCVIPGGLHYLSVRAPTSDRLPDGHKQNLARWLRSSNPKCHARVHLNPFGTVDGILVVSTEAVPIENLIRIYGMHESYLNDLVSRYDEELIPCLLTHMCQPGLQAVTHDRFHGLIRQLDEMMKLHIDDITPHTADQLKEKYSRDIDKKVFAFLEHNKSLLTMYQMP